MTSRIPTQAEYEDREIRRAIAAENDVDSAPLSERREARAAFAEVMKNRPAIVAERIGWLLDGSYGFGELQRAKAAVAETRPASRRAVLTQMIAVYEWRCPRRFAVQAWKTLSDAEKATLHTAIDAEINAYLTSEEKA